MKKVLSIVLSIAMVVCLAPTMAFAATTSAQADAAYSDTKGTACEGAVNVLSALKVVDGFTDGTYKPEQVVTRAQMAKLIVTALGVADYASAKTSKFTDMGAASWAIPYVEYASNLNIVNGVGNGKFNPNGNVTYEQAATMIVRALGYTDKCNEMNGSWPAIYIQKATALGLFNDMTNKGATGATRGDIAIMLYNALNVPEVYADNEGATKNKNGSNGSYVTMMDTLNVNGRSEYKIVTNTDADNAVNSIAGYVGAAAEVIYDKNDDVIALSDIKTEFLSGTFKSSGKFEADNGTTYTIASDAYKVFKDTDKGTVQTAAAYTEGNATTAASGGVPGLLNNITGANRAFLNKDSRADVDKDFTLAATVSGKTITGIYSIASWAVDKADKVDSSDLNQITNNKKLLGKEFHLNNDREIDTTSFILNGVTSLSDIKTDNVVYVYVGDNEITRVDVGTKTVKGTITKATSTKITIDGTAYETADKAVVAANTGDLKAGNEVTLYLDYSGDIYDADLVDGTSGNFAVVVATSTNTPSTKSVSGTAKIELLTTDGDKIFEVNGKKYVDNDSLAVKSDDTVDSNEWTALKGKIVKYSVNDNGQITKLVKADTNDYSESNLITTPAKISKAGVYDKHSIADSALIFAVPAKVSGDTKTGFNWDADTDYFSVVKKASVLDSTVDVAQYVVDKDTNKIVCMIIDDGTTSDDQYGIVTSTYDIDGGKGVDFYIGSEKTTDKEISGAEPTQKKENVALYKITKTTSGDYKFATVETTPAGYTFEKTSTNKVNVKNGYVDFVNVTTSSDGKDTETSIKDKYNLDSNAIVYVYNITDDKYSIGSTSDLTDDDLVTAKLYSTGDSNDDNYGLINYIVITMK